MGPQSGSTWGSAELGTADEGRGLVGTPCNTANLCSPAAGTHQQMGSPPPASSGTSTSRTSISDHHQPAETLNSPRGMKQHMGSSPDTWAPTVRRGQDPDTEGDTEAEATIRQQASVDHRGKALRDRGRHTAAPRAASGPNPILQETVLKHK